ncbi:MAG: fibrillarin [Candidatus Nitrosocaldaceae archaeon]|nr:MAG: fibrillarin [Candidatus Nitrosocaldaceae archaeon]
MVRSEDNILWLRIDKEDKLCTKNLARGIQVYGEKLIIHDDNEYRVWDPFRSKLAAAIIKGLRNMPIKKSSNVLYLGASTGTTVSHVSDIIEDGIIFAVEPAVRVARELLDKVAKPRKNVIPIIEDARKALYYSTFGKVDVVYCDIAQPDQTEIAITNCNNYLKENGYLMLVIKSRSIDVVKEPKQVIEEEIAKLREFKVLEVINLEPFDKDHAIVIAKYQSSS